MKRKYICRRCLPLLLASIMLFTGCSSKTEEKQVSKVTPMEKEESYAVSYDILGGKDVMPITGYYGPHILNYCWDGNQLPDYFTDEYFEMFKDIGINTLSLVQVNYVSYPEYIYKVLELTEKYGMAYFPQDNLVTDTRGDKALSATKIGKRLVKMYDYASFGSAYLADEPGTSYYSGAEYPDRYISNFEKIADAYNELGVTTYGNMYPLGHIEDREVYEQYVEEFIETFNPKILMWDQYPFERFYGGDMREIIMATSIMSKNAKEQKIPFWIFIQAGDQFYISGEESVTPYWPNEAQFNWNVNMGLAYGAQGIQYYSLLEVATGARDSQDALDNHRNGLIGAMGNKTKWYYYAKNINAHITSIDQVLMNSAHKGVIVSGKQATADTTGAYLVMDSEKFQELQSVDGDAMVGCFNYNGKTALYVVNYSMEYAQHITLNLDAEHKATVTQLGEASYVKGDSITLDMAAGEGVLVVIE